MPEAWICDVIGYSNPVCWLLVVRQHIYSEDLLCALHWEFLHRHNPRRASGYTHLSSQLAEGMGLLAAAPPAGNGPDP